MPLLIHLAVWDLRRLLKDRWAAAWLVVMPLAFVFIFGNATRDRGPQNTWIPVIDLDRTELSDLFIEQIRSPGYRIEVKPPEAQIELQQKWAYGIVIPAGFAQSIQAGKAVELTVVRGQGSAERILEVQSRLTHATVNFTKGLALADVSHRTWNAETQQALKEILARPQLLTVTRQSDRALRPPPSGFYLSLPGILVMFVMQMILIYGGTTLVSDRNHGQFSRLLAAPVRQAEAFVGKMLARVVLALVQSALILVGGAVLFDVQLGDHPLFLGPVVVSFAIFAGALSVLGGIICATEKQVVQLAIFATMVLSALGGCWWPIEVVPEVFKTIATFLPTYWGVHGLQSVLYFGKSYPVLTLECPILLAFAALLIGPAIPLAKQRLRGR